MTMTIGDHPAWESYLGAISRLAEAAKRLDHARSADAVDLRTADEAFAEALEQFDAIRERLA